MQVKLKLTGMDQAMRQLQAAGKKVDPILRGALNTTATKTRSDRYVAGLKGTLKGARVRSALKVKRANSRRMNSRIIPSSSGILLLNYQSWGYDPIDATRARLWVRAPNGRKVAAGFVNPSSVGKLPWNTRSKMGRGSNEAAWRARRLAMGPSAAYWFKKLTTNQTIRWVNAYLQQEFTRRMRKELSR